MKPFITIPAKGILIVLLCLFSQATYAQKTTIVKGVAKKILKREAKEVAKEFNEAAVKKAFVYGEKEIGKNYLENAVAKQTVRSIARKKVFKEIEEKELKSVLQYSLVKSSKQLQPTKNSVVKMLAHKEANKVGYAERIKDLRRGATDYLSRTITRIAVRDRNQFVSRKQYIKWLSKNPNAITKTGAKDASVLRQNMLKVMGEDGKYAKNTIKNGNQAHHIIGNKTPKAAEKLNKYGIDINDPMNGVFLPSSNRSGLRGTVHRGGHTQDYYDYVEQMFSNCRSKEDCYEVLDKLKDDLYKGNIKLYSDGKHHVNKTFS